MQNQTHWNLDGKRYEAQARTRSRRHDGRSRARWPALSVAADRVPLTIED